MTGYDLKTGTEQWSVPGLTDEPCITPVNGEGLVFTTSYNMKNNPEVIGLPEFDELLEEYDKDNDGELTREEIKSNQSILSRYDADGEGDHPLRGFFRFLDVDFKFSPGTFGQVTNASEKEMIQISSKLRAYLESYFIEPNKLLAEHYGLDLRSWES